MEALKLAPGEIVGDFLKSGKVSKGKEVFQPRIVRCFMINYQHELILMNIDEFEFCENQDKIDDLTMMV